MSGFGGEAEILCSTRALPGSDPTATPTRIPHGPRNRLDLSTAFEAGRAEVLAREQAASVPSAGITLQQTDTPFCRVNWPSQGRAHQHPTSNARPLMTHLIDKNLGRVLIKRPAMSVFGQAGH